LFIAVLSCVVVVVVVVVVVDVAHRFFSQDNVFLIKYEQFVALWQQYESF